ncbi:unnamed protein product [Hermetia illucens]|uniref:Nuclear pore complex protein Nup98-Nup96 n=1 Tax=Hermetia illucens TaxID=343691 RepID=A0A7R8UMN9_HERIL|nr:unnamed protein product [Hermetia illucens]
MFGGAKQTFGTTSTGTGFGFNSSATASPFSTTFGKPATTGFAQAPAFGQPNTSLFASTQPTTGTGLFGSSTTPAFGANTTTQPAFGGFSQTPQNASLFGTAQQQNAGSTSLFGQGFGSQPKTTGFAFPQQSTSLFGQATTSNAAAPSFGGFGQTATSGGMFGSTPSAFGQTQSANAGTSIVKYQETIGTDTLMKNGQANNVSTKQHCITAMKEYEGKSLEELRMEDYLANRKGPQQGVGLFGQTQPAAGGLFGSSAPQQTTGLFGQQTENKGLFGTNTMGTTGAFGQTAGFGPTSQASTGLFAKPFSTPATSNTGFSFGGTDANKSFGANPFGQTGSTSLFNRPATTSAFGQTTTGFGTFGQANAQQTNLFGFGTNTSTAGGGLFGNKPATGFGTTPGFGAPTSTASSGFGGFGTANQGSLFNTSLNKTATPAFGGFGTQTSTGQLGTGLNFGSGNLFNSNANKPGGLFGNTGQTGSLLGGTTGLGTTNAFGGFGGTSLLGGTNTLGGTQQPPALPIHQQIMTLASSPYGENPLFKDLKKTGADETDALKPTNPAAQKAILETTSNRFKVSPKTSNGVKVKPVGNVLTKKSLFEGLEEYDSTVEQCFNLKPNAKRLILKPKSSNSSLNGSLTASGNKTASNTTGNAFGISKIITTNRPGSAEASRSGTPKETVDSNEQFNNEIPTSMPQAETDGSRRESWLHPNALDKVKERNKFSSDSVMNNTLSELVSRKSDAAGTSDSAGLKSAALSEVTNTQGRSYTTASFISQTSNDSLTSSQSYLDETAGEVSLLNLEPHPTGIVLRRKGYYTIPSLDELNSYLAEDGSCVVPNFTIGRQGYGNVFFSDSFDVAGINLDDIVHFRHKEVIIYPDDENKPPLGSGLNRKAQITLDQVWPHDKTLHEPIKDPDRLAAMDYEGKLRRICDKHDTRFIEYRPETGSWVFKVEHFSKYGVSDSDEEDAAPTDPKKQKMGVKLDPKKKPDGTEKQPAEKAAAQPPKDRGAAAIGAMDSADSNRMLLQKGVGDLSPLMDQQFAHHDDFGAEVGHRLGSAQQHITVATATTFTAPGAIAKIPTSPTAALAFGSGTDAHKLQLMKASFFNEDDFDGKSVISENLEGRDSPDQIVPTNKAIFRNMSAYPSAHSLSKDAFSLSSSSVMDTPVASPTFPSMRKIEETTIVDEQEHEKDITAHEATLKSAPLIIKPKVATVKIADIAIPFEESISYQLRGKCVADLALYNCRRFKVGFGPQNNLIVLNTANNAADLQEENSLDKLAKFFSGRLKFDRSPQILQALKISTTYPIESFEKSVLDHLRVQLKHSRRDEVIGSDCPHIISGGGTELLLDHFELSKKLAHLDSFEEYAVSVWSLCQSLWGDREELEGQEATSHLSVMVRRNLFSNWLEDTVTEKDILNKPVTKTGYLDHLLSLLMCHKVAEACELAFTNDDANLSMLLAQISGGPTVRQLIQHQLSQWQDIEADKFISVERLKMFMLIAGVSLLSSAHGPINVLEEIDWLKALAVHLWYLSSPTSSITDALLAYESSFQAQEFYAMPPSPSYVEKFQTKSSRPIHDLRYHILKLYSKRSHPMESLLNPATHTPDSMDFRLSWLLLQTFETLGYHHCSELAETQINVAFANQLENHDMWHWAVFVLLHIKDKNRREACIQEMLYRYVELSQDENYLAREKFIVNGLGIPEKWIFWARAVKAGAQRNYHEQAKFLLKAKQWSLAHEVIMQHIAPDAIINDNVPYLHDLLRQFEDPRQVSNWSNQGQILLDFIEMNEKFENLKTVHEGDIETRWESLRPQLADLCSRINLLPCPTSKHRLCQSEIAQKLACLVRGVLVTTTVQNPCLLIKITLEKLPLPQEYAQQELRVLLDTYVAEMLKTADGEAEEAKG